MDGLDCIVTVVDVDMLAILRREDMSKMPDGDEIIEIL